MKTIIKLLLVTALGAALALTSACANIKDDRTRTQTEGTLAGAGIGALVGAAVGAAVGGRSGAARGALIGAAAGGIGGLAYGTHVANKKADYASEEAWLAACLTQAQSANQSAMAYNKQLKSTLAKYKGGGSSGYAFAGDGKSSKKSQSTTIKREVEQSNQALANLNNEINSQKQVISTTGKGKTKELTKQVNELEKQKKLMEQQNRELATISSRIAI